MHLDKEKEAFKDPEKARAFVKHLRQLNYQFKFYLDVLEQTDSDLQLNQKVDGLMKDAQENYYKAMEEMVKEQDKQEDSSTTIKADGITTRLLQDLEKAKGAQGEEVNQQYWPPVQPRLGGGGG